MRAAFRPAGTERHASHQWAGDRGGSAQALPPTDQRSLLRAPSATAWVVIIVSSLLVGAVGAGM
jgi:hypothetical protein